MIGWIVLVVCIVGGIFVYFHSQQANEEYKKNTWYQNATVIEKYPSWWGDRVLLSADDGKRYVENCSICMADDKVKLRMNKEYALYIDKVWIDG